MYYTQDNMLPLLERIKNPGKHAVAHTHTQTHHFSKGLRCSRQDANSRRWELPIRLSYSAHSCLPAPEN